MLHRMTGVALVLYLGMHLVLLSLLRRGAASWDAFVRLAGSPVFLALDVLLLGAVTFHAFNGIRVTMVGLGVGVDRQRVLFWGSVVLAVVSTVGVGIAMFLR